MTVIYNRVALIGLGLIASSMYWAIKRHGIAHDVTVFARTVETPETARTIGLCDHVYETPQEAARDADLVVLCVPVGAMGAVAKVISSVLKAGATLSVVGSVKQHVIQSVAKHVPRTVDFIPAHPLAGTEHSGPNACFAELFENRWCMIVPFADSNACAVTRLRSFWEAMGSKTTTIDAEHHDLVLSVTSHVPHLIAYTMVGVADDLRRITDREVIDYSAAGFRDFTRIAASDPTMWRDIFLTNKDATLEVLGRFTEELFALQRAIRTGNGEHLHDYMTRTRTIQRGIIEAGQDTEAPDFGR